MRWDQVISLRVSLIDGVEFQIGIIGLAFLTVVIFLGVALYLWRMRSQSWSVAEFSVNLGKIGSVTLRRNHEVVSIAHKAWTELQTRKAAIPFDEKNDTIIEIYDSYYILFKEFRDLIKAIPAEQISKDVNTKKLVDLMVAVLNEGLRPHLTKWQTKYRHWFVEQSQKRTTEYPQSIQKDFPEYKALIKDLIELNSKLQKYSDFLRKVAHNEKTQG